MGDDFGEDIVWLYHYTTHEAFCRISKSKRLEATMLAVNASKNPHDTCFGDGVYATAKSPDEFGSKDAILMNNFDGLYPGFEARADFCIPLVISRCLAVDVMTQKVPGLLM